MVRRMVEVPTEKARHRYIVRLHFGWVLDRLECVKVEIESDPDRPAAVTTALIRSIPFGRFIAERRGARDVRDLERKVVRALESGDEQQLRRLFSNPVVREAVRRGHTTQPDEASAKPRRGPAPRYPDAEVARLYRRMRREHPEAPLRALTERLGVSYWAAGQLVRRARSRGHLEPVERRAPEATDRAPRQRSQGGKRRRKR